MRTLLTLALLLLLAAIAMGGPAVPTADAPLDLRGATLILITVVVVVFEGARRLP